jgi:hypothetical protein
VPIADTTSSSPDLAWLMALLWPDAVAAGSQPGPTYGVISRGGRPKLIVPLDSPPAAAAAINRATGDVSTASSLARRLGRYGLRAGLIQPLLRNRWTSPRRSTPPSLESYFCDALGIDKVTLAVTVGPPRPNRKPVIELFAPDGATIGFAKVGWNGLTRHLVAQEAANLETLDRAKMPNIEAPRVLHHGAHRELDIVVLSPLSQPPQTNVRRSPTAQEVGQVATVASADNQRLGASPYAAGLRVRIASHSTGDTALLSEALEQACRSAGETPMRFGGWHGDWTPWNMLAAPTGLLVWDWERAGGPVPLGLDAIHYSFQSAWLREGASAGAAIDIALDRSAAVLAALGVPRVHRRLIGLLYLCELFLRYADNAAHGTDQLRAGRHDEVRRALQQRVGDQPGD